MATLFCFSSTGNSLFTAKRLAEKMNGKVLPMNNGPVQCEDDVIGFVFPVYFWGLPRMVERFVAALQICNKDAYVFGVATSGGPAYGVLGRLKNLLLQKGISLQYGAKLISVSNYLPEYTPKDSDERQKNIAENIVKIADAITRRQSNHIEAFTFLNMIAYRFYPNEGSDRYFTVAPTCTGCGTCQKVCPAQNIVLKAGKPDFRHNCEHCLACLHHCPVCAIDWKQKTQGKDHYRNAGVSLDDLISFNSKARS